MPTGDNPNSRKNLRMFSKDRQPTPEQRKKKCETQKANAAARRTFKQEIENLLATEITDKSGVTLSTREWCAKAAIEEALKGKNRIKAIEFIRDTIGEKPVDKIMVADVDPEVIAQVENMVLGGNNNADS